MIPPIPIWVLQVFGLLVPAAHHLTYPNNTTSQSNLTPQQAFKESKPELITARNDVLKMCRALYTDTSLELEAAFKERDKSDRFEGTRATLIKNATIFTGEDDDSKPILLIGDVLLDKGLVKGLGDVDEDSELLYDKDQTTIIEAQRAWLTPGLIDVYTHLGISSIPSLKGAQDANSRRGPVLPWLRAIDALNTHDEGFQLALASGVTTVQVLPGNENSVAGQPAIVKLRKTSDGTPTSMLVDPEGDGWGRLHHGCGEDLEKYDMTRMDSVWALRSAYHDARDLRARQDNYCSKAEADLWDDVDENAFPRSHAMVDALRAKVKVSVHCNEAVDLDAFSRLSNEFDLPIAVFHQASEAWLTPKVVNATWGDPPAVSLSNGYRSKRETFRGSEFAASVLANANISVVTHSGYPNLNPHTLIEETRQAFYHGLSERLALLSVTTKAALSTGIAHRVGFLRTGMDADIVLWDAHPLSFGATPRMIWVDGILQIPKKADNASVVVNPSRNIVPTRPNWDQERATALVSEGLPPLVCRTYSEQVVFHNVSRVWVRGKFGGVDVAFQAQDNTTYGMAVIRQGQLVCADIYCGGVEDKDEGGRSAALSLDLNGGTISPGFLAYGTSLGLSEILSELSTSDGRPYNALTSDVPKIYQDASGLVRSADALTFQTRNALLTYRSGVTSAVTSSSQPQGGAGINGLSTSFRPGAMHAMQYGAILQNVAALHVTLAKPTHATDASASNQIAGLRRLLHGWESTDTETGMWFKRASEGVVPLVIYVNSADLMASLLILKAEVEDRLGSRMRMVFSGAAESHLLGQQIADANVGVILNPRRPIPFSWDARRVLLGPPLSNDTTLIALKKSGVTVGIGALSGRENRIRFELAEMVASDEIGEMEAHELASKTMEDLLGIRAMNRDLVVYSGGGAFNMSSKPVGVISPERGFVDMF